MSAHTGTPCSLLKEISSFVFTKSKCANGLESNISSKIVKKNSPPLLLLQMQAVPTSITDLGVFAFVPLNDLIKLLLS
jgi:hypothetical protein